MIAPTASRLPLLLACGGSFLAFLDVTITNLAVPDLARDFGEDVSALSWVITLYTLLFAALLAPAGRLADVLGRRRLFALGVGVFTVGSAGAALAPSLGLLLAARGVQGVGAALLLPASLALVLSDTPAERRPAAIGLWAASAAIAATVGPALGGVLVDAFGWRSLFCINLPIGALLIYGTLRRPPVVATSQRLPDLVGTALLATGIGLLVLGLTQGQAWGWGDPATIACLVGAALTTAIALNRSRRHPVPAVQVDLWRNRTYAAANAVSVLFGVALYAWLLVGVLVLTAVWGYSELQAGLAMTPGALVSAVVGIAAGRSTRPWASPRALTIGGGLLLALCGTALWLWLPDSPAFWTVWVPAGFACGAGMGAISVGASSAAALSVAPERFAAATGLNIAARQVGGAVGVAVLAILLTDVTAADAGDPFRLVYLMSAIASVGVMAVGWRIVLTAPTLEPDAEDRSALDQGIAQRPLRQPLTRLGDGAATHLDRDAVL